MEIWVRLVLLIPALFFGIHSAPAPRALHSKSNVGIKSTNTCFNRGPDKIPESNSSETDRDVGQILENCNLLEEKNSTIKIECPSEATKPLKNCTLLDSEGKNSTIRVECPKEVIRELLGISEKVDDDSSSIMSGIAHFTCCNLKACKCQEE